MTAARRWTLITSHGSTPAQPAPSLLGVRWGRRVAVIVPGPQLSSSGLAAVKRARVQTTRLSGRPGLAVA